MMIGGELRKGSGMDERFGLVCCGSLSLGKSISRAAGGSSAVLALGAALLLAGPSASAAAPEKTAPPLPKPHCKAGTHALMPYASHLTPHGAAVYDFKIKGVKNEVIVPPKDFHPLHAPDALLKEFGYPRRPPASDPAALTEWRANAAKYKGTDYPSFCVNTASTFSGRLPGGNASPSPATSPATSTPSAQPSPESSNPPSGRLAFTGSASGAEAGVGGVLVLLGSLALWLSTRRRSRHD
jgi:hypothetical protein